MRKAVPVIIFTIFLAGCHGGGSAPATVTKTITVPASKPAAQRPSRPTTTSAVAPAAGAAAQQTIVQQAPQPIYEPAPVPTIYNPEPDRLEPDVPLGFTLLRLGRRNRYGIRALVIAWMTRCMSGEQPCLSMGQRDGLPSAPGRVRLVWSRLSHPCVHT